ncbi:MAG: AmmeMemoRadiSam system protein B [bacterium]|nr:AmmeMemoRadiSam system protein B [Gammaproteobacteria bacterium]HIL95187.1 AmmeMemoRadiSam system protein B [Pseudomonadales bacterium]
MNNIRQAAVSGSFYPSDPNLLQSSIEQLLAEIDNPADNPVQKALIVPHAGYVYSGPIAASIYAGLTSVRSQIKRVVLLGPSHHVGFKGIAACSSDGYQTPLGLVDIDQTAVDAIIDLPNVAYLDEAHLNEHSLEVHLPFLQIVLDRFELVPLVVGDATKQDVARVLEKLWGGPETLIVISSDLSHFHTYAEAQQLDSTTADKILNLQSNLTGSEACGCRPINGLLYLAEQRGFGIRQIDVRNSGDTAGSHDRVVGYGAFSLTQEPLTGEAMVRQEPKEDAIEKQRFSNDLRARILKIARQAILHSLQGKGNFQLNLDLFPDPLKVDGASFITLNLQGHLRGCIGSLEAHRSLILDIANNAQAAAFKDPRFKPLSLQEYHAMELHVSILSPPELLPVNSREELLAIIRPGKDGIIIEESGRRATYLPSVWDQLPDPDRFISELRSKAGLDASQWGRCQVFRYTTEEFM